MKHEMMGIKTAMQISERFETRSAPAIFFG